MRRTRVWPPYALSPPSTTILEPSIPERDISSPAAPSAWKLLGYAFLAATVMGVISSGVTRWAYAGLGEQLPWPQVLSGLVDWYLWAALTPLVAYLARKIPVMGEHPYRAVAVHAVLAAVISAAELALFALIMIGYNELFPIQPELLPYYTRWLLLVGRWLPLEMLVYLLIVAVVTAVHHGRLARERDVAASRLQTELARTQVHALQAQIQPHFLFNTLNTISMAVREGRSRAAVSMMAQLSGILRRGMEGAVRPETTLRRELQLVRAYLRLERYRMEDRLEVRWQVDRDLLDEQVPTMILQPVVENAVRHGIADLAEGGRVTVRASREDGDMVLTVEDTGAGLREDAVPGVGVANVRRRLEAHYGDAAAFTLSARPGGGTVARITLPRDAPETVGT